MIWFFVRTLIWITGLIVVTSFVIQYFSYQVNWSYFEERRTDCQERIATCRDTLIESGVDGAKDKCDIVCVDPTLIIKKSPR